MRLRPGEQMAEVMWAQQFHGDAVDCPSLEDADRPRAAPGLTSRAVRTTAR